MGDSPNTIYFEKEADAKRYMGYKGQLTFAADTCALFIHDGCCCGGKKINGMRSDAEIKEIALACIIENQEPDDVIESGVIADGQMTLTTEEGNDIVIDVSSLISTPHPEETGFYASNSGTVDVAAQTISINTVNDETEKAGPPIVIDISALMEALTSTPHPMFTGNGVTYDAETDTYTFTDTDTDTDTFGTIDGEGNITFPDGTSGNLSDTDDQVITSTDGSVDITQTATGGDDNQQDYDLSIKAAYSDASPIYPDIAAFFAEASAQDCPIGGTVNMTVVDGGSFTLPTPTGQEGDRVNIKFEGTRYAQMTLDGPISGLGRSPVDFAIDRQLNGPRIVRDDEMYQLVVTAQNTYRVISYDYNLFHGDGVADNWRENDDGYTSFWLTTNVNNSATGPNIVFSLPLPALIVNSPRLVSTIIDRTGGTGYVEGDLNDNGGAARWSFTEYFAMHDAANVWYGAVRQQDIVPDPTANPSGTLGRVSVHIENARLDYAAL